jgi:hypothetical protein
MTTVVSRAKKVATLTEGHEPDEQGVSAGQALATPSHIEQTSAGRSVSCQHRKTALIDGGKYVKNDIRLREMNPTAASVISYFCRNF